MNATIAIHSYSHFNFAKFCYVIKANDKYLLSTSILCVYICVCTYVSMYYLYRYVLLQFTVSISQQQPVQEQYLSTITSSLLQLEGYQIETTSNSSQQPQRQALGQNQLTLGTQQESELCT